MNDDQLRAAYRASVESRAPLDRVACPPEEELATLARGRADGEGDLARLDHVLGCARCLPEFELLRAVSSGNAALDERATTGAPPRTPSSRLRVVVPRSAPRFVMAATVVLAIGLAGDMWRRSLQSDVGAEPQVVRGSEGSAGDGVVLITPSLPISAASAGEGGAAVLQWHAVDGTVSYVADVLDTLGASLLSRTTSDTVLQLDRAELERLQRAGAFDWMVSARRLDGNERRSTVTRVQLADVRR